MSNTAEVDRRYIVRTMKAEEIALAIDWAADEGWNPGRDDARCFHAADPHGFFVGEWDGVPVASISAVAYDERFGFIGLYIVKPEFRGKGLGLRIWRHALAYLGERNIGLDGVVAQQANYRKSGFALAQRNIRFQGVVQSEASEAGQACVDLRDVPFEQLAAYDRHWFPAPRERFLRAWLAQPAVVALASLRAGRMRGYGVLRVCREGRKIGPLFADDEESAAQLFDALLRACPGEPVMFDVPQSNAAAIALAERHGMHSSFETARMYTQAPPAIPMARVFGITSFELG